MSDKKIEAVHSAVGGRIKMIRKRLGLRQIDLANRLGLHRVTLANMEDGRWRIALHKIGDFATALDTTPKNLLKGIWW